MKINSNIAGVIARTTQLRDHDIPTALMKAAKAEHWVKLARDTAERTLLALADPSERNFIPIFLGTLTVFGMENGFGFMMTAPFMGMNNPLQEAQTARAITSPREMAETRGLSLFASAINDFEQMLLEWVEGVPPEDRGGLPFPNELKKVKDQRDAGKTDEEIMHLISWILLTPTPNARVRAARDGLTPHIEKYIANRMHADKEIFSAHTASTWLQAVLLAWREMVRVKFPERFSEQLKIARTELAI